MFLWASLPSLPKVPQHFVDRALSFVSDSAVPDVVQSHIPTMNSNYRHRQLTINGQTTNSLYLVGKNLGSDWESWVKENIITNFFNTGVRVAVGNNTTTHGVHCDFIEGSQIYKFYYLLNNGGDDSETVFYKQKGYPLERDPADVPYGSNLNILDYSEIDEVARLKIPTNQWLLLNTSVLHGVENTTASKRIHLTVMVKKNNVNFSVIK